jgi:LPXTG-site transpeptidase (sortase) family protein
MTEKLHDTENTKTPGSYVLYGGVFVLLFLFLIGITLFLSGSFPEIGMFKIFNTQEDVQGTQIEKPSVFEGQLEPLYDSPVRLFTESKSIDINLVKVGVDEGGIMETPENWDEGGWYSRSSRPGEIGNIIINAHYDTNYGFPAAFFQLKNLAEGDKVFLVDDLGRYYAYEVNNISYVDIQDPNRLKVLDDVDEGSELTLITCGGVFLNGSYNKRLVVKASFVDNLTF